MKTKNAKEIAKIDRRVQTTLARIHQVEGTRRAVRRQTSIERRVSNRWLHPCSSTARQIGD